MFNKKSNEKKDFQDKSDLVKNVLQIDRVTRVQAGGRRFRFRALVVTGDKNGTVGIGVAKGKEVATAIAKATDKAKKNEIKIDVSTGTIKREITLKKGSAYIFLKPARKGTGVIAGGAIRAVLEAVGIHDCLSKTIGTNNKLNNAIAVVEALKVLEAEKA